MSTTDPAMEESPVETHQEWAEKRVRARIEAERYEAETRGVTINGVRYGGSESNRQALREAVDLADDQGFTEFIAWKDSDGNYHSGHPVDGVRQALRLIGKRRSALIELEAQHIAAIVDDEADPLDLDWSTQYD